MRFSKLLLIIKEQSGSGPAQRAITRIRQDSIHQQEHSHNALPYTGKANTTSGSRTNINRNILARLVDAAIFAKNSKEKLNLGQNLDIRA